ncbi:cation:proton antiporter [Companilactobacillus halodurans]|uniref:Sodium:proton antiporter n=1 Tax=Companilactobacillus halodurans TaxID=2584183 RepID=A0A5P0ZMX7_9LACO|nr:sodium:proton antiporter [Companilactobacillus halodurans]MQS75536.1 sodium:proton antiporter [Companilactobacillus halodurans]MQS97780.1 sodium:proton antiporter [Companilactobacillus halodurans]
MEMMISTFIITLAAVISIFLAQAFQKVSVSYFSMLIGGIVALIPALGNHIENFSSEIFIGLIVAPLLFFEGQATRLNLVGKEFKHIVQTALFLVVLCMIAAGFSVWFIGDLSLPLAFILAAISTPTDATALDSVSNGLKTPNTTGTFLKLESLFNDATGIILLNMTVLWYVNGYIDYGETILDFLISAVGGVLFGFLAAFVMVLFRQVLLRTSFNSLNAQNILYIITPLIIYYLAEKISVSGIIAVVCAGLVHNAEAQRTKLTNAPQVQQGFGLVSMITEIFNSMVFVILGFMFVKILSDEKITTNSLNWIFIGIILYLVSLVIRYFYGCLRLKLKNRSAWIFSLGGVHGAVTLALAYTLAEAHVKTGDFNLVLMSESVLIILSLIVPTIIFRFILPKDVSNTEISQEVTQLRQNMVHRAVEAVNQMYLPDNVKQSVIYDLRSQKQRTKTKDFMKAWLDVVRHPEFTGPEKELEMRAFMNAFSKERAYLDMISQSEIKYQDYVYDLYNEVLLAETLVIEPLKESDDV